MKPISIKQILEIPEESNEIEFKRLGNDSKTVKSVLQASVAMANADGGTIILGVSDPEKTTLKGHGRIFGIEENKENFDEIIRCLGKVIPQIPTRCEKVHAPNDKTIALLRIPKAQESLHSVNKRMFIRLNKGNKELAPHEALQLSYAKGFKRAEAELVDRVSIDLLETTHYQQWAKKNKLREKGEGIGHVLESKGLARKGERTGTLKPTRAAVLLFAEHPTNLMETKCAVKIAVYTTNEEVLGETPNFTGVPQIIQGAITQVIQETQRQVLQILNTGIEIRAGFKTSFALPERAVKEGITNAIIHRDYHIKQDIEINIFPNRIEITNPGLFPFNITKHNIGNERAMGFRNDLIIKTLRDFPEPPNLDRNESVKAMRGEMEKNNLYPPLFITYPDLHYCVKLVLKNEKCSSEWKKIRNHLAHAMHIDNAKAREITGITQTDEMSRTLANWVAKGLLKRISPDGSKKSTLYTLPSKRLI